MLSHEARGNSEKPRARVHNRRVVGLTLLEGHEKRLRHDVVRRMLTQPLRRIPVHRGRVPVIQLRKRSWVPVRPLDQFVISAHICIARIQEKGSRAQPRSSRPDCIRRSFRQNAPSPVNDPCGKPTLPRRKRGSRELVVARTRLAHHLTPLDRDNAGEALDGAERHAAHSGCALNSQSSRMVGAAEPPSCSRRLARCRFRRC